MIYTFWAATTRELYGTVLYFHAILKKDWSNKRSGESPLLGVGTHSRKWKSSIGHGLDFKIKRRNGVNSVSSTTVTVKANRNIELA